MKRALPLAFAFLNIACILAVLHVGHGISSLMVAERLLEPDGVDGVSFFAHSSPAVADALVANVAWGGKALIDACRRRSYDAFAWLALAVSLWLAAAASASFIWRISAAQ